MAATRYRNVGLFVVLVAVWGSVFIAIRVGLEFSPPVLFAAFRYGVAGVVMLTYALYVTSSPPPRGRAEWIEVAIGAVFLIAAYHVLLFIGEVDPTVTSVAAITTVSLSPVLTARFARLLLPSERLALLDAVGLLLGSVGVVVLSELDPSNFFAGGTVAEFLIFGAAAASVLGSVLTRRVDSESSIETMETWLMFLGTDLMHIVSVGLGERPGAVVLNVQSVVTLAYLSLAANALGFLIYSDLPTRLGPIEISLVSYAAPVFVAFSGWAFLSEAPTLSMVDGFAFILLGFVLLKRGATRHGPRYRFGDGARVID